MAGMKKTNDHAEPTKVERNIQGNERHLPLLPFLALSTFFPLAERLGDPLLSLFLSLSLGDLLRDSLEEALEPFLPDPKNSFKL